MVVNIIMMLVVHFGYKRMYLQSKKIYEDLWQLYLKTDKDCREIAIRELDYIDRYYELKSVLDGIELKKKVESNGKQKQIIRNKYDNASPGQGSR